MTSPTFIDIVERRVPVHVVCEDADHLAWLAPRPVRPGHVIVATRAVADSVFDLDAVASTRLWAFVHQQARNLRERMPCERVCVSVIGWVVRHAHVHLVPTDAAGQVPGLDGPPLPTAEMAAIAARLTAKGRLDAQS